jgi:hypothetical protein
MSATLIERRAEIATVYEAVADLPDTSAGIAQLLERLGITGFRYDGDHCPLAEYIRWRLGHPGFLVVDACAIEVAHNEWFDTPDHVADFIRDFDRSCYPTLVERLALPAPAGAS